ncbi:MAG: FHA domain-containing protein [Blastocatellia bacterium]|nr:FHA domain-containing protein [Blastocatellia bacterium]
MRAKLQVTNLTSNENVLEKVVPPELDIVTIGRHPSSYVYLTSAHVSKEHALIIQDNDSFYLIDKSSNGTLLNQARVERDKRIKLKSNDVVTAGEYQITFTIEEDQAVPQMMKAPAATQKAASPATVSNTTNTGFAAGGSRPLEAIKTDALGANDDPGATFASLPTSFQDVIRGLEPGEESSYLVMVGGKRDGQRVELKGSTSEVFVGRGANCQVQIDHASISPTHAKVRMDWAGITVYDLNSQTGVFINGVRIASSRKLHNGDEISFGIPTSAGGIKLILYDRNSISGDNWIGVPPPITIKNNEPTENKESKGSDKAKVEEKPISKDAASAAKAEITAKEPEKAEKKVEKTEAKADETQVQAGEIEEPAKNMLDMNRVLVAGLTIRDILFISMLLVFVLIFFVIGLSFL